MSDDIDKKSFSSDEEHEESKSFTYDRKKKIFVQDAPPPVEEQIYLEAIQIYLSEIPDTQLFSATALDKDGQPENLTFDKKLATLIERRVLLIFSHVKAIKKLDSTRVELGYSLVNGDSKLGVILFNFIKSTKNLYARFLIWRELEELCNFEPAPLIYELTDFIKNKKNFDAYCLFHKSFATKLSDDFSEFFMAHEEVWKIKFFDIYENNYSRKSIPALLVDAKVPRLVELEDLFGEEEKFLVRCALLPAKDLKLIINCNLPNLPDFYRFTILRFLETAKPTDVLKHKMFTEEYISEEECAGLKYIISLSN